VTRESVAVVVVTHNRADLLVRMLDGLAAQTHAPDAVIVVDNGSTDHTADVLAERVARGDLPLEVIAQDNVGGAGGFHRGALAAYDHGYDRTWLVDDDVVPAPGCLAALMAVDEDCLIAVREDLAGALAEKAAIEFDLHNPLAIRPKRSSVDSTYADRASMPALVEVQNVAFEGFLVRRSVVEEIGFPDPSFFIFYDDVDFALRAREAGRKVWAVRDAVLVRQLDFNQQHDLSGWKGFYMYRNLFVVHLRHGENVLVRLKPLRGGPAEARNVIRAMASARGMRRVSGPARPPR
jgi:rhamnopyranosyl-N-acetylglucosaminyl-diphospho-decaprenol beta-1,3/1,4-galactofuranosyltransferase